jgi:hypothetical protein
MFALMSCWLKESPFTEKGVELDGTMIKTPPRPHETAGK